MNELVETVKSFASLFSQLNVPYAIMGGWAVRLYGLPRPTYDIDFTIGIVREDLPRLYEKVEQAGYTVPEQFLAGWIDSVAGMPLVKFRLYVEGNGIDIDVFIAESDYQDEILKRRKHVEFQGLAIAFVSPEDLILLKLIAARHRDLGDIEDVLLAQPDLDEAYMRRWAEPLGVTKQLDEMLASRP